MDLGDHQITIPALLADPRAREVLARRFPQAIDRPSVAQSGAMTLERAMKLGAAFVSRKSIQAALEELQAL